MTASSGRAQSAADDTPADHSIVRKEHILSHSSAANVQGIGDAVVAKDGEPFLICPPDGQISVEREHAFGLYHHDMRFLNGYELRIADQTLDALAASEASGTEVVLELTNDQIEQQGRSPIEKDQLGVTWRRRIDGRAPALEDEIEIRNYGTQAAELGVEIDFASAFDDVFAVRGMLDPQRGKLLEPSWQGDVLVFGYSGVDRIDRFARLSFDPAPAARRESGARFDLVVKGRERETLSVRVAMQERPRDDADPIVARDRPARHGHGHGSNELRDPDEWVAESDWQTTLRTNSLTLSRTVDRSLRDLELLRAQIDERTYYAAGVPWFATIFGRDSMLSAFQTLAFDASIMADTLRLLAEHQGKREDEWLSEQPGKIMHELRVGELARSGQIPHTPSYATVDATPLFLIMLAAHAGWTGSLDLFEELAPNVERALAWLDDYADSDGDGFADYGSDTRDVLVNQGWKDSGNAIVYANGHLARPPVALAEVQGYVYRAWIDMAELYGRAGDEARADGLTKSAAELKERFEDKFWSAELGLYRMAIAAGEPCEVVSSNAGQVLWSGIAAKDRAQQVARRLMESDMFNGWGIRTLSSDSTPYQPIGYHLGTVWPHDVGLIAEGMRRYGCDDEAEQLFVAMLEAAQDFPHGRLPECLAGFGRDDYGHPVRYPVACHPQAWSAGAIPHLLMTSLGLRPHGFERTLRVVRPRLPRFVDELEIRNLTVGSGSARLRFRRSGAETLAEVIETKGSLEVEIE